MTGSVTPSNLTCSVSFFALHPTAGTFSNFRRFPFCFENLLQYLISVYAYSSRKLLSDQRQEAETAEIVSNHGFKGLY